MADWAIIFDVDGVLLELTREEEELFFQPFASRCDASQLSRDWNSYRIRNDEEIVAELVARYGLPDIDRQNLKEEYLCLLHRHISGNQIASLPINGAAKLLERCSNIATLGIATANFREAAKLRLAHAGLWHHVSNHAFGADGGGHKHEILARALSSMSVPKSRTIYVGDNLNDVEAGLKNDVNFIGFSQSAGRLKILKEHGVKQLSGDHLQTFSLIRSLLDS